MHFVDMRVNVDVVVLVVVVVAHDDTHGTKTTEVAVHDANVPGTSLHMVTET